MLHTLVPMSRRILMASHLRPIIDAVHADKDAEDEGKDENAQKEVYDSAVSDSDDEEPGDEKVVDDRAEQDGHENGTETDVPHADTFQQEECETEVGQTRNEGGSNEQWAGEDDSEGDKFDHIKPAGDGQKESCPKAIGLNMRTAKEMIMKSSITMLRLGA